MAIAQYFLQQRSGLQESSSHIGCRQIGWQSRSNYFANNTAWPISLNQNVLSHQDCVHAPLQTASILLPLLILNLKAKAQQKGDNLNKYLYSGCQKNVFTSSHNPSWWLISRGEALGPLGGKKVDTAPELTQERSTHTTPCALAAMLPSCMALPGLPLPHTSTEPLWPGKEQQVLGDTWSQTGNGLPWPMSPAFSWSQGKRAVLGDSTASALCRSACSPWIPHELSGNGIKITRETALTEN